MIHYIKEKKLQSTHDRITKLHHNTICIGHSLGAHVCGFMGNTGNELLGDDKKALDRIIALDPAGNYFMRPYDDKVR